MPIEDEVAALTASTTALLNEVQTKKSVLDASVASTAANLAGMTAALAIMLGYANSAGAQAAAAAVSAQAAASVAQQDLSGVTNAGLHFSPNAIVDTLVYDTSRDSDPSWPERCLSQSWANEALNGPWLAPINAAGFESELAARCHGATLGPELAVGAWTPGTNVSISGTGSSAVITISGSPGVSGAFIASQAGVTSAGKLFAVTYTILSSNGQLSSGGGGLTSGITRSSPGTYTEPLVAFSSAACGIIVRGSGITSGVITGVSIREVVALTTPSGAYYNLATDGKHYRLLKNLLQNSEAFAAGSWGNIDSTPTDNAETAPDGTSLSLITEGTAGTAATNQTPSIAVSGTTVNFSGSFKRGNHDWVRVQVGDGASNVYRVWVNTQTGALGTPASVGSSAPVVVTAPTIRAIGNGVHRVSFAVRMVTNTGCSVNITSATADGSITRVASGTRLQGAMMLEFGSAETAYERRAGAVGGSQSETWTGNSRTFPRTALCIAEAGQVTIYAADLPGRPMWRRFLAGVSGCIRGGTSIGSISASNGELRVGIASATGDMHRIDFIRDAAVTHSQATGWRFNGNLAQRNTAMGHTEDQALPRIASRFVNAIAVMVRPNAPIDPTTGLPVPTIGVAVGTGNAGQVGTVLMDDGTAVTYAQSGNDGRSVAFTRRGELVWGYSNTSHITTIPLSSSNVSSTIAAGRPFDQASAVSVGTNFKSVVAAGPLLAVQPSGANRVTLLREHPASLSASLLANITGTHSTGWMVGDIRRCLLAETVSGAVSNPSTIADRSVRNRPATVMGALALSPVATGAQLVAASGFSSINYIQEAYSADLDPSTGALTVSLWGSIPTTVAAPGWALDRSAPSGAYYRLGHSATGQIVAELFDGSTIRTLTTTQTYASGQYIKARMSYVPAGASSTLTITVNGQQVAQSTFAALASLSNAAAPLTVGIDRALTAPWAGALCLVKAGFTVPTAVQGAWVHQQERGMFQAGAQVTLSDTGAVVRMRYGDITDRLMVQTASAVDEFQGLVRITSQPSAGGSYVSGDIGAGGVQLLARNNGGSRQVTVTIPPRNLQAELYRRTDDAARLARVPVPPVDYTAAASQTDFPAPPGFEIAAVLAARSAQREGSAFDFVRLFDGFQETVRMNTGQAVNVWVQLQLRRAV